MSDGRDNYDTELKTPEQKQAFNILCEGHGISKDDVQMSHQQEEVEGGTWVTVRIWVPEA